MSGRCLSKNCFARRSPDKATYIEIEFEKGDPVSIDGKKLSPEELLTKLNALGGENGIGRLDMVENRSHWNEIKRNI